MEIDVLNGLDVQLAQLFGPNSLARVMGIILPADSIGQTCFPFLLGMLRDGSGSYQSGLAIVIALALGGAVAIAALPGQKLAAGAVR